MTYTAEIFSDLYKAGYRCDGQPLIGEQFYVVIENENGRRFAHDRVFNGYGAGYMDDEVGEMHYPYQHEEARAQAQALCDRVNAALEAGQRLDQAHWTEVQPAYGSKEYIDQQCSEKEALCEAAGVDYRYDPA